MSTRKTPLTRALVVVRTRPDGSSTRHEVARAVAPDRDALATSVAADPALHEVRRGEIVEVTVDETVARPVEVLAMLRTVGRRAPEDPRSWPEDVAEGWMEFDEEHDGAFSTATTVPRWVRVNGLRATAVLTNAEDATGRDRHLHLLLFDEDADERGHEDQTNPLALEALAEWSYDNDWGSAGGMRLDVVAPALVVECGWGDSARRRALYPWPHSRRARKTLVERWESDHVPDEVDDLDPENPVDEPDPVLNGATMVMVRRRLGETTTFRTIRREQAKSRSALAALLAADPALHEVRRGELLKIAVDPRVMAPIDLLALLRPVGDMGGEDEAAWPEAVADAYLDVESMIEDYVRDTRPVRRWVTVNGVRATGVLDPDDEQQVHLVLLDDDEEGLVAWKSLAESHWASDGAGALMVGNETFSLELVAPGLLVDRRDGDDPSQSVLAWPEAVDQQAVVIRDWARSTEQEVAAALALEPFDPSGTLDEQTNGIWRERLAEVELSFDLHGRAALVRAVRSALDQPGSAYALTREALAAPTGERGAVLAAVLDACADEQPVGAVRFWTSR